MLLNSFNKHSDKQIRRINRYLRENYGFSLSKNVNVSNLNKISEQITKNIYDLKIQGNTTNSSPEITKLLIMKEGVNVLAKQPVKEGFGNQHNYDKILSYLTQFIVDNVVLGDDIEDALSQAMKEYRSSRYRFPDEDILMACKQGAMQQLSMNDRTAFRESISTILTPTQKANVQAWLVVPGAELTEDTIANIEQYYTRRGNIPSKGVNLNEWYQTRLVKDFTKDLKEGLVEAAWDDIDNSGRHRAGGGKGNVKPEVLDKYLKGSTLSMSNSKNNMPKVGHDDDSDEAVAARVKAFHTKQQKLKDKKKQEATK